MADNKDEIKAFKDYAKTIKENLDVHKQNQEQGMMSVKSAEDFYKRIFTPGSLAKSVGLKSEQLNQKILDELKKSDDSAMIEEMRKANAEAAKGRQLDFQKEEQDNKRNELQETQVTFLEKIAGSIDNLADNMKDLDPSGLFGGFLLPIMALLGTVGGAILAPLFFIAGFFTTLFKQVKWIFSKFSGIKQIGAWIAKKLDFIKDIFKKILKPFDILLKPFKSAGKAFKSMKSFFGLFDDFIKPIGKITKAAFKFGKAIPVVGQLLAVVLGVFDFVKGFIAGFKEGGFVEGLKQGLVGLIDGMLVSFLDLIKDGVSMVSGFVANAFGIDNTLGKWLDSFSFSELFKQGMDFIFSSIPGAIDTVLAPFKDIIATFKEKGFLGGVVETIKKYFSILVGMPAELFRKILAWGAEAMGWENVASVLNEYNFMDLIENGIQNIFNVLRGAFDNVMSFIPDSIKSFFGIGKKEEGLGVEGANDEFTLPTKPKVARQEKNYSLDDTNDKVLATLGISKDSKRTAPALYTKDELSKTKQIEQVKVQEKQQAPNVTAASINNSKKTVFTSVDNRTGGADRTLTLIPGSAI